MKILQNIKKIISKLFSFSPFKLKSPRRWASKPNLHFTFHISPFSFPFSPFKLKSPLTLALSPNGRGRSAFTLAEVLITLGIIGVVAEMTIPNLIAEYQKDVWANQLKKVYSTLSNATNFAIADNGQVTSWNIYNYDETVPGTSMKGSEYFAKTYLIPYLSISKILGNTTLDYAVKQLNGKGSIGYFGSGYYKFILNDGSLIMAVAKKTTTSHICEVYVDTNGAKPPNTWGKDVHEFVFWVSSESETYSSYLGKLYPWENHGSTKSLINGSTFGCNKNATERNEYCTIIIMRNSWKIPNKDEYVKMGGTADEYPW